MKKTLIIITFLCALIIGAVFIIAIPKAERNIQAALQDIGFKNTTIKAIKLNLNGINFKEIQLDKNGFNIISNLKADIFWPQYLFSSKIKAISIEEIKLSAVPNDVRYALKKINNISKTNIINNITIENIILDLALSNHALRFEGYLQIKDQNKDKKEGKKAVTGRLSAAQHEISFKSEWSGFINVENSDFEIDSIFSDLKINSTPLHLNRGSGWISYNSSNSENIISAQFDAGNGKILNIPAKNISLIIGQNKDTYPVLFRANAAGIQNVQLTGDFHYAHNVVNRKFSAMLNIPNTALFFNYLKAQKIIPESTKAPQNKIKHINTLMTYMPEKRFAGGPLPFDLSVKANLKNGLTGTFLIYPDSFDIRGTTEANTEVMNIIKALFPIPEENITDNIIRLDGNIKSLIN
jgi:uncharacterized protein YxeA